MLSFLTNPSSLSASRTLEAAQSASQRTMARLSSGLRVSSARDDASGLAIASRMQAQSRAITVDLRGLNDLVSLVQIADGALVSISNNLQRIRELALQAMNGTNNADDRKALQAEVRSLNDANRQQQAHATFNGQSLLDGALQRMGGSSSGAGLYLDVPALFLPKTTDTLTRLAQLSVATTTVTPAGSLGTGDLRINGTDVAASVAGNSAGQSADSAWAIANAINQSAVKGLTAQASATTATGSAVVPPSPANVLAGSIVINGVAVAAGNYVNAINAIAGQTGVSASTVAGVAPPGSPLAVPYTLVLRASDGRNIDVSGAGAFGLADTHAVGTVTLTGSLGEHPASDLVITGANPGSAGLSTPKVAAVDSGEPVAIPLDEAAGFDLNPNVSTQADATSTLGIMDRKLDQLLAIRTTLGAALNVLDMRSATLAVSYETSVASQGRILDADYAAEMVDFTRNQIAQATGMAIVAQANMQPNRLVSMLLADL